MVVSGHEVVEALERAGFRREQHAHGLTRMSCGDRVVFVPILPRLDESALALVLLHARLTLPHLVELLEPPTARDLHLESHVRERRVV